MPLEGLVRVLVIVAVVLVILSVAGQWTKYFTTLGEKPAVDILIHFLNLDQEKNLPSFFSGGILIVAAQLLAFIAVLEHRKARAHVTSWTILSLGFLCMSADELFEYHERLSPYVRHWMGGESWGFFHFAWIIPGTLLSLFIAVLYARFLLQLPARTRWLFLLSGAIYLGGAIGMESVGGEYSELHGTSNFAYSMLATVEESMEMGGVILFIHALVRYIYSRYGRIHVTSA